MRRRELQGFRNIRKNSPETGSDLGQFNQMVARALTVVVQARRPSETVFDDLDERKVGKGFVSFVAVSDGASEANARRVTRHLHRQAALTHPGSVPEHNNRSVTSPCMIDDRPNRAAFSFATHDFGWFGEREWRSLEDRRRGLRTIGTRWGGFGTRDRLGLLP